MCIKRENNCMKNYNSLKYLIMKTKSTGGTNDHP